jgi:hypothetical protein
MTADRGVVLELKDALATSREKGVPVIARNARLKKDKTGWRLGDISGTAGEPLYFWKANEHEYHSDFATEETFDGLELIRRLERCGGFAEATERAADLSALHNRGPSDALCAA